MNREEATDKATLRRRLRDRLAAIEPEDARAAAARVARRVLGLPELARARHILTCLSFGAELDTWQLVEQLLESGREVYVPRANPAGHQLYLHRYPCPLETLSFGLRQPPRGTPELPSEAVDRTIQAVLVLGLGFDRRGYRLGYGGGYFDRFLSGRPFPAIGLAYDAQLLDELPREAHDVPMTAVVTETGTWRGP